ncbi:hypothetical protein [Bradyrhizobium sp. RP6]|uniref:hypothetical protein n=1 Tax=Bradyrhizobium sp. RP6 TaxID=2489596 RepID=UPI000F549CAA|nr:hypothetical protein [Bradyrhizobium sp. RP6]RQH12673.1 hypothetical protein EHH60_14370 [Bradyrhizobium sp. RP6]
MVMIESAPDPLEPIFQSFEKRSGWKVSPQARIILKEGLIAARTDMLGLGDFATVVDRDPVADRIIKKMPKFLDDLQKEADSREKAEKVQKTIGGVFVLQNMGRWQSLFGCTCWPV